MKPVEEPKDFVPVPNWREADEARTITRRLIAGHLDEALAALSDPTGTGKAGQKVLRLALRLPPGLGKTRITLEEIARSARDFLAWGHIAFYCPSLDLAEEAAGSLRAMDRTLPVAVLRGRGAINPHSKAPMCKKHKLARQISGFVPSVKAALCVGKDAKGEQVAAPCAVRCPYLGQFAAIDTHPHIIFAAHSYLVSGLPIRGDKSLVIIDERFWQQMTGTKRISREDWLAPGPVGMDQALRKDYAMLREVVVCALEKHLPVIEALRSAGLTDTAMRKIAQAERASIESIELSPKMTLAEADGVWRGFDREAVVRARARAAVLDLLAERFEHPDSERLTIEPEGATGRAQHLVLHRCRTLPEDAPCLLLDADADEQILAAVAPGTRIESIDVRSRAHIRQISDLTCSGTWLLDEKNCAAGLDLVLQVIAEEVRRGRTLVVATRPVLARLAEMTGTPADEDARAAPAIAGAEARWFGPRLLGVNSFADFDSVIILGRQQPPVVAIETATRCLFGDGETPLVFVPDGRLKPGLRLRLLVDGQMVDGKVQVHPDPRGNATLGQWRETMTLQAIARLRLITPDRLKRVIILSNLPLPGLPIDELWSLRDVAAGAPQHPQHTRRERLVAALGRGAQPAVPGFRLSASGLAEDLPTVFASASQGGEFRRGLDTDSMRKLVADIATDRNWPYSFVELRRPAGGKPVPAVILAPAQDVDAEIDRLWPGLSYG